MKNKNRRILSALVAIGLALGGAVAIAPAANATTAYPEGGTWNYGFKGVAIYSDYYHASKKHRTTACRSNFCARSEDKPGGSWATQGVQSSATGNQAYYYVY